MGWDFFEDHPKFSQRSSEAFSGTGSTHNNPKVFCKPCLAHRVNQQLSEDDLQVKNGTRHEIRSRETIVIECASLQSHFHDTIHDYLFLVFAVPQQHPGREWLTAQTDVLINHLVSCELQPEPIHEKARIHKASMSTKSPQKAVSYHNFGNCHLSSEGGTAPEPPYPRPLILQF